MAAMLCQQPKDLRVPRTPLALPVRGFDLWVKYKDSSPFLRE